MKQCPRCKVVSNNFAKNKTKKDGLQTQCKPCVKETNAAYYLVTPEKNKARLAYKDKSKTECRDYVKKHLQANSCVDCGEKDWVVLEFDHLFDKSHNISKFTSGGYSLATLVLEIKKCDVRCANCHRRVTAQRGNWWRTLD